MLDLEGMMFVYSLNGERVAEIVAKGAPLDCERRVSELIAEVLGSNAQWVVIPAERLGKDFFQLATKAGAFVDKFVANKLRIAILGDLETPESELGREGSVLFLRDCNDLYARLAPTK